MAIDILVVEDEYTERQELTQLPAVSGSDPAGYHAAGQFRL